MTSPFNGLLATWFMPLWRHFMTSCLLVYPVTAVMTGWTMSLEYKYSLISCVASYPSMNGILQSIKMRLYWHKPFCLTLFLTFSKAYLPLKQKSQRFSASTPRPYLRMMMMASMLNCWSSTIKIRYSLLIVAESVINGSSHDSLLVWSALDWTMFVFKLKKAFSS